ncbi:hypothetical protein ACH5RR_025966 [Cinchona calisaya]|uniref:Uncharacterized protein n=1 Tax=Cinchona calisaya TaxID=153742 RepID=A0ABD2Z3E7_9GENT
MTTLKKKRGPTRNIALSKKRKVAGGVKSKVDVSEESRRVIGEGAQAFISEASCVIRKFVQAISKRNKKNREKQKTSHTAGTKSYLRHKAKQEAKEDRSVGPIELYEMTHFSKKKNGPVDEKSTTNVVNLFGNMWRYVVQAVGSKAIRRRETELKPFFLMMFWGYNIDVGDVNYSIGYLCCGSILL